MRIAAMLTGKWNTEALEYEIAVEKNKLQNIKQQLQATNDKMEQLVHELTVKSNELARLKSNKSSDDEQISFVEYEKDSLEGEVLYLKNLVKEQRNAAIKCEHRLQHLVQTIV